MNNMETISTNVIFAQNGYGLALKSMKFAFKSNDYILNFKKQVMTRQEFERHRITRMLRAETTSPLICDVYKDVKEVQLVAEITFNSGVLSQPSIREWKCTLFPTNRLYLHYECINKDCTSNGFDLSQPLSHALSSRTSVQGEMRCTGKEDWKYARSAGCTCMTTLKYKITPVF